MNQQRWEGIKIKFPQPHRIEYEPAVWSAADIGEEDVLFRTEYSLISPGTELALFTGTHIDLPNPANRWAKLPFYPGYASVGEVVAAGRGAPAYRPGMKIIAPGHHATCDCVSSADENLIPLPDAADPVEALFTRLAEIASAAVVQARFAPGQWIAVIGMGLIGNLAAQLFALQGARVVAADPVERRLAAARACGIAATVRPGDGGIGAADILAATGGEAPHVIVEATGVAALVPKALELVRPLGRVILLGSPRATAEIDLYRHIHTKGVSLVGAHDRIKGMCGLPSVAATTRYVLDLIVGGRLSIAPLISRVLPYGEAEAAYDGLLHRKDEWLGVAFDWRDGGAEGRQP